MGRSVCLIPGDGIGPEITRAALDLFEAAGAGIDWVELPAGAEAAERYGEVLPEQTIQGIEEHRLALKGPTTTPLGGGHISINVRLRRQFNLYAAVRPVRSLPGLKTRYEDVDIVVIRENTEGLYSGLEHEVVDGVVESIKVASRPACERIARFAFNYAKENGRKRITVFHKANIMKMSDGLFLSCARETEADIGYGIDYDELIIDNGCLQIVRDPSQFDILLLENLYGDVVSDLCAGLVGGLGVVPGANLGEDCAIFESVHGSAPDIAGKGVANPLALIMSGVMLLKHIGKDDVADRIESAYSSLLRDRNPDELTGDIGGKAGTKGFADALIRRL